MPEVGADLWPTMEREIHILSNFLRKFDINCNFVKRRMRNDVGSLVAHGPDSIADNV